MRREKAQAGKRHTRRVCGYGCTLVGRWRRLLTPWQPGGACCTTRTLRPHRHTPSATRPPTGTRPQVPSEGDPDVLLACVDCGAAFSLFSRWRVECEHCHNVCARPSPPPLNPNLPCRHRHLPPPLQVFCHDCLSLRHELFDGVSAGSGRTRRRVCSYCFFQLCARHCKARAVRWLRCLSPPSPGCNGQLSYLSEFSVSPHGLLSRSEARCCADLPIRTLRRFLARKGISTRGAAADQREGGGVLREGPPLHFGRGCEQAPSRRATSCRASTAGCTQPRETPASLSRARVPTGGLCRTPTRATGSCVITGARPGGFRVRGTARVCTGKRRRRRDGLMYTSVSRFMLHRRTIKHSTPLRPVALWRSPSRAPLAAARRYSSDLEPRRLVPLQPLLRLSPLLRSRTASGKAGAGRGGGDGEA